MTELADDVLFHLTGFAQGVLDLTLVAVLGLAIFATGRESAPGAIPPPAQVAGHVAHCAPPLLGAGCITEMVLQAQDS